MRAATWLWSRRDLAYKAAAAIGLALILHGGTALAIGTQDKRRVEERYEDVLAAVAARDDARTLRSARRFLLEAAASPGQQARAAQVAGFYQAGLLREILWLHQQGKDGEAALLLAERGELLRHVPAPSDPARGDSSAEGAP